MASHTNTGAPLEHEPAPVLPRALESAEKIHNGSSSPPPPAPAPAEHEAAAAVRFASNVQEFAPAEPQATQESFVAFPDVTPEELKALSKSLQGRHLQERRMNVFSFEPMSLPASRVNSLDEESQKSQNSSRQGTPVVGAQQSPRIAAMASPPLTPSGTDPAKKSVSSLEATKIPSINEPQLITPQATSSAEQTDPATKGTVRRSASSDNLPRKTSSAEGHGHEDHPHRRGLFTVGGSVPVSREASPSRTSASQLYSRPFTPAGDANDPYAASKRAPVQPGSKMSIDPRFIFSRKKKNSSPTASTASLASRPAEKRHSGFFSSLKAHGDELTPNTSHATTDQAKTGSMSDLKRFFKGGGQHKAKRPESPLQRDGTRTPPSSRPSQKMPFGEDHGLTSKYGKLGRVLGSGAGGSVRLMKRAEDNTVFAVKEFRPRHSYETEKEYIKKLTAEFCVGSTLHHGNVIETLDIVQEKGKWYEVMEYAPYDLFAIVMTGRMTREEVRCCFLQILNGVTYLHSMGLAHRDLKLDNVVVTAPGIMKIIDFGSAHVFKYPFETSIVPASGIVGSDPYLAPEVYDERKYDPQAVDIWSLAIIFCCMSLRRFPWKVPRMSDSSFRLFAAEPTPGHDPKKLIRPSRSTTDLSETPARDIFPPDDLDEGKRHRERDTLKEAGDGSASTSAQPAKSTDDRAAGGEKKEVIRGPWRILRLLPRESRHIIGRMLEIKPRDRAGMAEILEEPWVANTVICQQTEFGKVVVAEDHGHILEPPGGASAGGGTTQR